MAKALAPKRPRQRAKKEEATPEERLRDFWRKKVKKLYAGGWPAVAARSAGQRTELRDRKVTFTELASQISQDVWAGLPLTFLEYHLAIGLGYLLAEDVTYEKFYTTRWFENDSAYGYGARG